MNHESDKKRKKKTKKARMGVDMDAIWGPGPAFGASPTRAAHEPEDKVEPEEPSQSESVAHGGDLCSRQDEVGPCKKDGDEIVSTGSPPSVTQPDDATGGSNEDHEDPTDASASPKNRSQNASEAESPPAAEPTLSQRATWISNGIRQAWRILRTILLSRPVLYTAGFVGLMVFVYMLLKFLLLAAPALVANKMVYAIAQRLTSFEHSTSQWLSGGKSERLELPVLNFDRHITKDESEVLPKALEQTYWALRKAFPVESYHLQASFEQSRIAVEALGELNAEYVEEIEAQCTRDYHQLKILVGELDDIIDNSSDDPPWWSLRSASWYRMQEATRYQQRLLDIVNEGYEGLHRARATIDRVIEIVIGRRTRPGEGGVTQVNTALRGIPQTSWLIKDILAVADMISRSERRAWGSWMDISVAIYDFQREHSRVQGRLKQLSKDAAQADATLRQIRQIAFQLTVRYESFARLQKETG
ncbi:hypothetical protein FDECE_8840 [Fusarium decemcellulare]|nr:hypothetical protein FDECE_8840 [Fusarium decemcellulare]